MQRVTWTLSTKAYPAPLGPPSVHCLHYAAITLVSWDMLGIAIRPLVLRPSSSRRVMTYKTSASRGLWRHSILCTLRMCDLRLSRRAAA